MVLGQHPRDPACSEPARHRHCSTILLPVALAGLLVACGSGGGSGSSTAATGSPPTITSVSGIVQPGEFLTIVGANMVNEDRTNWDPFFRNNVSTSSFEGINPSADGYSSAGNPSGGSYDSSVKLLGSKSMKFHIEGASTICPDDNKIDYNGMDPAGGDQNDYWIRLYARWRLNGGGWPRSHIKMIDCEHGGPQYYFQPAADIDGNLPTEFIATFDSISTSADIPSGQLENDRWYGIEIHWKTDGSNIFTVWIDGTEVINAVPLTEGSLDFLLMGLINACLTDSSFNLDHWWDGFAVSTSRVNLASIVEIGNSSDYATATKVYQAPQYLSDTSSQIKVNLAGLGAGPYFLWVTNNRGERSRPYSLL